MPATQEIIETHAGRDGQEVFYSRSRNLRLVRRPKIAQDNALGHQMTVQESLRYDFAPDGTLVVKHGEDVLPDGPGGEMQDAVAWLTSHPRLNEFFHHEGHEAGRPQPNERDYLQAVNVALVARDVEQLEGLREQERATHGRPVLVTAVNAALEALEASPGVESAPAPADEPLTAEERAEAAEKLQGLGVEVPDDATDAQIRAALVVTEAPSDAS